MLLVLSDPLLNYSPFLSTVLQGTGVSHLDVYITGFIDDSILLNNLLLQYYGVLRARSQELGYDYSFAINIVFNQPVPAAPVIHQVSGEHNHLPPNTTVTDLESPPLQHWPSFQGHKYKLYGTSAVGGTFDHLHDGHKILISMAAFLGRDKLILGVTGQELLVNKKYASELQSFAQRQLCLAEFIARVLDARFYVYEMNDVCGPTGYVGDIDALIVSEESSKGGAFVNNYRKEHNFHALEITSIKVVGDDSSNEDNNWKGKISSTDIRQQEYNKR